MKHNSLGLGDIHRLANWEYASASARTSATSFTADDIGKIAKQTDNNTFWELTAVTPAWLQIGGGSNIQVDISIGAETSNEITVTVQLQDSSGNNITSGNYVLYMFLSDDNEILQFTTDLPDGFVSGVGTFSEIITSVYLLAVFENGEFELTISKTGEETWFLVVILPDGTFVVSEAISFAA